MRTGRFAEIFEKWKENFEDVMNILGSDIEKIRSDF